MGGMKPPTAIMARQAVSLRAGVRAGEFPGRAMRLKGCVPWGPGRLRRRPGTAAGDGDAGRGRPGPPDPTRAATRRPAGRWQGRSPPWPGGSRASAGSPARRHRLSASATRVATSAVSKVPSTMTESRADLGPHRLRLAGAGGRRAGDGGRGPSGEAGAALRAEQSVLGHGGLGRGHEHLRRAGLEQQPVDLRLVHGHQRPCEVGVAGEEHVHGAGRGHPDPGPELGSVQRRHAHVRDDGRERAGAQGWVQPLLAARRDRHLEARAEQPLESGRMAGSSSTQRTLRLLTGPYLRAGERGRVFVGHALGTMASPGLLAAMAVPGLADRIAPCARAGARPRRAPVDSPLVSVFRAQGTRGAL